MAVRALIFGVDDLFPQLKPFYEKEVQRGNLEIGGYAVLENDKWRIYANPDGGGAENTAFNIAIISSTKNFYQRMKQLESFGVPRNRIIDGRVFQVPNLDFPRLLNEGVAYGFFDGNPIMFMDRSIAIYPRIYKNSAGKNFITLSSKSYIIGSLIEGGGSISVANYSSISWNIKFNTSNGCLDHNHYNITSYGLNSIEWNIPQNFYPSQKECKITIGNDVWIGKGSSLHCSNPEKPLIVGDGAVIASDSVVVKNVPPYAIVGGNPARIIKYRFSEDIIEALLRIKWWNWDIDKIYENFKYFNRVEEFVALHDK